MPRVTKKNNIDSVAEIAAPKKPRKSAKEKPSAPAVIPTVETPKPKRSYNRKPKNKVALSVRNITKEKTKTEIAVEEEKTAEEAPAVRIIEKKAEAAPRPARIIKQHKESDKRMLMWTGVTFFALLIGIFWIWSSVHSIEKTRREYKPSEKAMDWDRMARELGTQIAEIKSGVNTIKEFASTSETDIVERPDLFASTSPAELREVDPTLIDELKRELETKEATNIPTAVYFQLSQAEEKAFIEQAAKISTGMSLSQVRDLLGEADFSEEIRDRRGAFVAQRLDYYVSIKDKDSLDEAADRYLSLDFDAKGKLVGVSKHF